MSIDMKSEGVTDDVVASVAAVLSIANQCARERGDFMNKRGGDVFVFVDASTKSVTQVLLGQ
jgi:hypothetical protein